MQIIIHTDEANTLRLTILKSINDKLKLPTWLAKKDKRGYDIYYHSTKSKQWENELFIKPSLDKNSKEILYFRVTNIDGEALDFDNNFGYLMGRFMEILIVHFSDKFSKIEIV